MKTPIRNIVLNGLIYFFLSTLVFAHPSSSMIYSSGNLYWVYISPINNVNHNAAILKWNEDDGVSPFLVSQHSASDFTISKTNADGFHILESYYSNGEYKVRLLEFTEGAEITEVIPWFTSQQRIDQHGFFVDESGRIVFCRFPDIFVRETDGSISSWYKFGFEIYSLTAEGNNQFLVRGESNAALVDGKGNLLQEWTNLLEEPLDNQPFRGNFIYDADYDNDKLLIAYWGKRKFDMIESGRRYSLKKLMHPYIPHAVLINRDDYFLLASTIAPGEYNKINPVLWRVKDGKAQVIWGEYKKVFHRRMEFK